ncbi:phage scaffolding protein [Paenisporosarcina sp. NPDC076898]|uniref:phage scaffolding protein n=1 Tax=unclassified Paenisporosarcina TaxID=2642018 RepID=UPI003D008409
MTKFPKLNLQFFAEENNLHEDKQLDGNNNEDADKTFTKAELEEIIKKRVARIKNEPPADYDELKSKLKEYEEKDLTEFDKIKQQLTDKESHAATLEKELNEMKAQQTKNQIVNAFKTAAKEAKIKYVDDAMKLIDMSAFTIGEDGKIEGLEDVVKTLAEEKPFLLSEESAEIGTPSNPGNQDRTRTKAQLLKEAGEQYKKTGRIQDLANYNKLKQELDM